MISNLFAGLPFLYEPFPLYQGFPTCIAVHQLQLVFCNYLQSLDHTFQQRFLEQIERSVRNMWGEKQIDQKGVKFQENSHKLAK